MKWYKVKLEFYKQDVVAHIDDKFVFCGTTQINQDQPKNRIIIGNLGTASFRNLKMWPGKVKKDWPKLKKKLLTQ